jgi:hypothetical protein
MKSDLTENKDEFELTIEMKVILDERLQEDDKTHLTAEESIKRLNIKYGLES